MTRRITRRRALGELLAGTALMAAGCGTAGPRAPAIDGSTLRTTYQDQDGSGILTAGPGEWLRPRTELGPRARVLGLLATVAHVTDAHILDAESPARVTFLDRLGPPFQSTFRPHETLTSQVLAGALYAIRALGPDAVIQGGDLVDNDQANELDLALTVLKGGRASPGSGAAGVLLRGAKVRVPPDSARRQLGPEEAVGSLQAASRQVRTGTRLDYRVDIGPHVRALVLDLARRGGGSGGLVHSGQATWLAGELAAAGERWMLVISHQPLDSSAGGEQILALLDRHPRVIAAISGHFHRNRIIPRLTPAGGYWLISTASLIDYPQQARALRVFATADDGVAIQTWMLDHVFPGELGTISRQLAYLDAQGGRAQGLLGGRLDRNVTLYRAGVRA